HLLKSFDFDLRIKLEVHDVSEGVIFSNTDYKIETAQMKHAVPTLGFAFVELPKRKMNLTEIKKLGIPQGPLWGKLQAGMAVNYKGKVVKPEEVTKLTNPKKISYITDTLICDNAFKLALDSDLLICEATFVSEKEEKAEDHMHMTAQQAALIANRTNSKKLVLTHFSARYKTTEEIEKEAKTYFDNTLCAYDFMKIRL
ncbi:MAG: MBL fold metallo-hydrolase, partial [Candidatus Woesearchaeota archaeon]